MTWVPIFSIVLIGLGMFAAGIASGPRLKRAWWSLQDRLRALRPLEAAPVPDHPRFGPLLGTPPQGIEVTRDDGVLSVRADHPVQRRRAEGDPFTGEMPKLTDELYEELRAERPPTIEELREEYNRWRNPALVALSAPEGVRNVPGTLTEQAEREMRRDYFDGVQPAVTESVSAWRPEDVTYEQAPVADVLEAERLNQELTA